MKTSIIVLIFTALLTSCDVSESSNDKSAIQVANEASGIYLMPQTAIL